MKKTIILSIVTLSLSLPFTALSAPYDPNPAKPSNRYQAQPTAMLLDLQANGEANFQSAPLSDSIAAELTLNKKDYRKALRMYLKLAPNDPQAAKRAVQIALTINNIEAATKAAVFWANQSPMSIPAQRLAAELLLRKGSSSEPYVRRLVTWPKSEEATRSLLIISSQPFTKEQRKEFLKQLQSFLSKHKNNARLWLIIAANELILMNYKAAIEASDEALQTQPYWLKAIAIRTQALLSLGKSAQALKFIQNSMAQQSDNHELRMFYAQILVDLKQYSAAKKQFNRLLLIPHYRAMAQIDLAKIALKEGHLTMAKNYLRKVIIDPTHSHTARYLLAVIAENENKTQQAIMWYLSVTQGRYFLESHIHAAELMAKMGEVQQARNTLQAIPIKTLIDFKELQLTEAEILYKSSEYALALDVINNALRILPNDKELLLARAVIAEQLQDYARVKADLQQVLAEMPNDVRALNAMAYVLYIYDGNYEEALKYINKAIALDPENPAVLDTMGWMQYQMGNKESSLSYLKKAYHFDPKNPEIAAHYGELLWVTNNKMEAKNIWRKARKSNPNNKILQDTMERFKQK